MKITVKLRLRDNCAAELTRQAKVISIVWNYCNEAQKHVLRWDRFLSKFDLMHLTKGTSKELGVSANSIQHVCKEYARCRKQFKKPYLRWRTRKSLGWVPFSQQDIYFDGKIFIFRGLRYIPMHLRALLNSDTKILCGSFNQDARGRWYINCSINIDQSSFVSNSKVGIDLGLNNLAVLSTGKKIKAPQYFRKNEIKLAIAQKAHKQKQVKTIHAKIANQRKDFLHKESNKITKEYGLIIIGNVSSKKLAQTKLAKSVFDASWYHFKHMLRYKALMHGGALLEVNEAYTSQTCSHCGKLPDGRPKGIAGLGIRVFSCSCGVSLDRDVNAARNILRIGTDTLAEGAFK